MFRFWGLQEQQHPPTRHAPPPPPPEAAGVIVALKDKSADELRKLLSDKDSYQRFLVSLHHVNSQTHKDELCKENLLLVEENLQKESRIKELMNQCRIIRTSELDAAKEKLSELEMQKDEMLKLNSPASILQRIQESINKTEEESENLCQHLLDGEIDLGDFLQNNKKLRAAYHRKTLIHVAAKTSNI